MPPFVEAIDLCTDSEDEGPEPVSELRGSSFGGPGSASRPALVPPARLIAAKQLIVVPDSPEVPQHTLGHAPAAVQQVPRATADTRSAKSQEGGGPTHPVPSTTLPRQHSSTAAHSPAPCPDNPGLGKAALAPPSASAASGHSLPNQAVKTPSRSAEPLATRSSSSLSGSRRPSTSQASSPAQEGARPAKRARQDGESTPSDQGSLAALQGESGQPRAATPDSASASLQRSAVTLQRRSEGGAAGPSTSSTSRQRLQEASTAPRPPGQSCGMQSRLEPSPSAQHSLPHSSALGSRQPQPYGSHCAEPSRHPSDFSGPPDDVQQRFPLRPQPLPSQSHAPAQASRPSAAPAVQALPSARLQGLHVRPAEPSQPLPGPLGATLNNRPEARQPVRADAHVHCRPGNPHIASLLTAPRLSGPSHPSMQLGRALPPSQAAAAAPAAQILPTSSGPKPAKATRGTQQKRGRQARSDSESEADSGPDSEPDAVSMADVDSGPEEESESESEADSDADSSAVSGAPPMTGQLQPAPAAPGPPLSEEPSNVRIGDCRLPSSGSFQISIPQGSTAQHPSPARTSAAPAAPHAATPSAARPVSILSSATRPAVVDALLAPPEPAVALPAGRTTAPAVPVAAALAVQQAPAGAPPAAQAVQPVTAASLPAAQLPAPAPAPALAPALRRGTRVRMQATYIVPDTGPLYRRRARSTSHEADEEEEEEGGRDLSIKEGPEHQAVLPAVVQRPEGPKEPSCQEMYWLEGLVCKPGQLGPEGRLTPITTLGPGSYTMQLGPGQAAVQLPDRQAAELGLTKMGWVHSAGWTAENITAFAVALRATAIDSRRRSVDTFGAGGPCFASLNTATSAPKTPQRVASFYFNCWRYWMQHPLLSRAKDWFEKTLLSDEWRDWPPPSSEGSFHAGFTGRQP